MKHPMKQHQTLSIQRPYTSVFLPNLSFAVTKTRTWHPSTGRPTETLRWPNGPCFTTLAGSSPPSRPDPPGHYQVGPGKPGYRTGWDSLVRVLQPLLLLPATKAFFDLRHSQPPIFRALKHVSHLP